MKFSPVKQSRKVSPEIEDALLGWGDVFKDLTGGQVSEVSTLAPVRAAEWMDGKRFGLFKRSFLFPLQDADKKFQTELKQKNAETEELFED